LLRLSCISIGGTPTQLANSRVIVNQTATIQLPLVETVIQSLWLSSGPTLVLPYSSSIGVALACNDIIVDAPLGATIRSDRQETQITVSSLTLTSDAELFVAKCISDNT
jgi:hypothetical protein